MSSGDSRLLSAEQLRRIFDHRFTVPAKDDRADIEEFLGVRINSKPYAIQIEHLIRIEAVRKVVALPGLSPDHGGIAGIQGRLIAVFRLAHLLDLNPKLEHDHWIAVCHRDHPIGFSFQAVDGLLQFSSSGIVDYNAVNRPSFLRKTIVEGQEYRPIIDVIAMAKAVLHDA